MITIQYHNVDTQERETVPGSVKAPLKGEKLLQSKAAQSRRAERYARKTNPDGSFAESLLEHENRIAVIKAHEAEQKRRTREARKQAIADAATVIIANGNIPTYLSPSERKEYAVLAAMPAKVVGSTHAKEDILASLLNKFAHGFSSPQGKPKVPSSNRVIQRVERFNALSLAERSKAWSTVVTGRVAPRNHVQGVDTLWTQNQGGNMVVTTATERLSAQATDKPVTRYYSVDRAVSPFQRSSEVWQYNGGITDTGTLHTMRTWSSRFVDGEHERVIDPRVGIADGPYSFYPPATRKVWVSEGLRMGPKPKPETKEPKHKDLAKTGIQVASFGGVQWTPEGNAYCCYPRLARPVADVATPAKPQPLYDRSAAIKAYAMR